MSDTWGAEPKRLGNVQEPGPGRILVVMYHHIREPRNDLAVITPDQFEEQLDWLMEVAEPVQINRGVSIRDSALRLGGRPGFIITIDDGWRHHLTVAERLENRNLRGVFSPVGCMMRGRIIPPSLFLHVAARQIGWEVVAERMRELLPVGVNGTPWTEGPEAFAKWIVQHYLSPMVTGVLVAEAFFDMLDAETLDAETLTIDDVADLERRGHVIAGHSMHHERASRLTPRQVETDAYMVRLLLAEMNDITAGRPWTWPFGDATSEAYAAIQRVGFDLALKTDGGYWKPTAAEWWEVPRVDAADFLR